MRRKHLSVLLVAAAMVGCAGLDAEGLAMSSRMRESLGDTVRDARIRQTLDPEAARRPSPQIGIDAPAAVSAWRRYQESFRSPPPAFEVLGIGTVGR